MPKLTKNDRAFLRAVGIKPEPILSFAEERLKDAPPQECDEIVRLLHENGIPLTRNNYLAITYLGHPPAEPLDAEAEENLPWFLQESVE
jgi:hypothetical protein